MRPIDADELKKDLTRFYDNEVTAKQLIDEQPTIEPERKTGQWIFGKDTETGEQDLYAWTCSECGNKYPWQPNFCPNCGAKMEGERKE